MNTKKEWLTLNKAVEYLSLTYEEEITVSDIYQLAIENQLTLSVRFLSPIWLKNCKLTDVTQANFSIYHYEAFKAISPNYKYPRGALPLNAKESTILRPNDLSESELIDVREAIAEHQANRLDSIILQYTIGDYKTYRSEGIGLLGALLDKTYPYGAVSITTKGLYIPSSGGYVSPDKDSEEILIGTDGVNGIWDIPYSSASKYYIETLYQKSENNTFLDKISLNCGFYLINSDTSEIVVLYDYTQQKVAHSLKLPNDSQMIIRTSELMRLINEDNVNEHISARKETSYLRYIALLTKAYAYASVSGPKYGTKEAPNKSKIYEELEKIMPEGGIHGISSTSFSDHVKAGLEHLE